jgi:hypothetical protein
VSRAGTCAPPGPLVEAARAERLRARGSLVARVAADSELLTQRGEGLIRLVDQANETKPFVHDTCLVPGQRRCSVAVAYDMCHPGSRFPGWYAGSRTDL